MKAFKFENLTVWQMALEYVDLMYHLAEKLPASKQYNLASQLTRAATSISLNIAEGSTGQTDAEQKRFLGLALRSLIETVACQRFEIISLTLLLWKLPTKKRTNWLACYKPSATH